MLISAGVSLGQTGTPATAPAELVSAPQPANMPALRLDIPHSRNPLDAYRAVSVAQPNLANSPRIDTLIHDGVLELSLKDAVALALENNLDLAIARYNIPIAQADVSADGGGCDVPWCQYGGGVEYPGWGHWGVRVGFEWGRGGWYERGRGRCGYGSFRTGAVYVGNWNGCVFV